MTDYDSMKGRHIMPNGKIMRDDEHNVVFQLKEQDPMTDYNSMKGRHIMPNGKIMLNSLKK